MHALPIARPPEAPLQDFHGILTVAPEMERLLLSVRRAARATCSVVLIGETGTGKELVARALHAESNRRQGPFAAVNCATLSSTLLESELFGHVRGAFTGAVRDHPGLFRTADGGTLFLDEVTEIPLSLQGRLLRVLQERNFVPVGGTRAVEVDVRIVSASNKSIRHEVAAARFREDLAYRLRVVPIYLPPLRERSGDVEALFWRFVSETNPHGVRSISAITARALEIIRAYPWPGNVRELRNVVEYAQVMGEGPCFDLGDLPPEVRGDTLPFAFGSSGRGQRTDGDTVVARIPPDREERARILDALARHKGRRGAAAADLGMSRQTLWRKLYVHGLR